MTQQQDGSHGSQQGWGAQPQPGQQPPSWQQPSVQPSGSYQQWQQPYVQPTYAPAAVGQVASQQKKRGWIVALVAVILLFVLLIVCVQSCSSVMTAQVGQGLMGMGVSDAATDLDSLSEDAIGVIELSGTIQYDGTTCSPEGLKEQLDLAEGNDHVKAVVLRVDSGGGTATAGEEMANYLRDFSKPVVVSSASINASAAYEISSQADYIYVAKTTEIGAIGTAMQSADYSGLMDKLGIRIDNITSADSKDSSYGTRALTDEERAYYQAMVDQINECFIETVAAGRGMSVDEVRELATGLVFTGIDAVDNGLADDFGTKEDALEKAAELAGISSYTTVDLDTYSSDLSSLLSLLGSEYDEDEVASLLKELDNDGLVSE